MIRSAKFMTFDLTQSHIDQLDAEQYSLFLAYGDTFRDPTTDRTGTRSVELWQREVTRILAASPRKELRIRKRVRYGEYFFGAA